MADEDTATLVAETIAEAEAAVREKERLAKEGEELFRAELPGSAGEIVRRKQNTMVRSGDTPLPERVRFYRSRSGVEAWLPTVQLAHYLAKRHADGTQVFVKHYPGEKPVPIDETCEVCLKNQGNRKIFYEEFDYISHMENKHPREWRIKEKKEAQGGGLLQVLIGMDATERAAINVLLGGSDGNEEGTASAGENPRAVGAQQAGQSGTRIACPECGKRVKPKGLTIHRNRYCSGGGAS